jgi:hypothetical protein
MLELEWDDWCRYLSIRKTKNARDCVQAITLPVYHVPREVMDRRDLKATHYWEDCPDHATTSDYWSCCLERGHNLVSEGLNPEGVYATIQIQP